MAITLTPFQRYLTILGSSFALWVIPISIKAPNTITLISLIAAITGFISCFQLADGLRVERRQSRNQRLHHEEIEAYQLALQEEATKRELYALYFPQSVEPVQQQAAQLPPAQSLPPHLESIVLLASENGGSISARSIQRALSKYTADQIKAFLLELQQMGIGQVSVGAKNALTFHLSE